MVLPSSLRPLNVSTEDYGKMWLSFSHDTKQNLKLVGGSQGALDATLSVLEKKLRLHVVEIIGEPCSLVINLAKQSWCTEAERLPEQPVVWPIAACSHLPVRLFLHRRTSQAAVI